MSEPRLITPLLAGHLMGDPISEHHGVRCCPAIAEESGERFIVKIISIPASQVQVDAMLLTGACHSHEDALAYFKSLADDTVREAELLKDLSRLEGFISYEGWQTEPMDDGIGYDVYLIGSYRRTLERQMRREPLTHLAAVNLGLDLCAALSVCRRKGYLYVDLKPGNIFVTGHNEYRICDLGFIRISSLKYASLPDKYRSAYTAPEITDAYSSLNTTLDIYAAGLILYQVFNNGELPGADGPMVPPAYADYEMAEIIMKACAADPADRWQDPQEMGQALAGYLQRNTVNDTPIIPAAVSEPQDDGQISEETDTAEMVADIVEEILESSVDEAHEVEESPSDIEEDPALVEEEPSACSESPVLEEVSEEAQEEPTPEEVTPESATVEQDDMEQFILEGFRSDETAPSEEIIAELEEAPLSDEVNEMLAQADELIAHKAPDPVVAPEPIEVPMPESIVPEEELEETPEEAPSGESEADNPQPRQPEEVPEEPEEEAAQAQAEPASPGKKRRFYGRLIGILSAVLIALLIGLGIFYYYENYYLQTISNITLDGEENHLTVVLDTQIDNSLLTVICTDTYGNTLYRSVQDNTAVFTDLPAGMAYKISVVIEGTHELVGTTSATYTTPSQTSISNFTAITGDSSGSVILSFSVQGTDNTAWYVKYAAEGASEKTVLCTGHMAMIAGLEVGSVYTFRLVPEAELYVVGETSLEYIPSNIVYAENLSISGYDSGALMVDWDVTEDESAEFWTVRCYNADGFDTTMTVTDTCAAIEGLDPAQSYTVDVKASGMSVSKWISITANSITFKQITFDDSIEGQLTVSWDYEGVAPADGWRLMYTVDGSEKYVVQSDEASCTISPLLPGGHYSFSFQLADDITVFGGTAEYEVSQPDTFSGYGVKASKITFRMCWTPDDADWRWYQLYEEDFTTEFAVGESASFVLHAETSPEDSDDEIATLFVIKNADGVPLSITQGRTRRWSKMWYKDYTELDMPTMPQTPGDYTVDIYFNGEFVTTESFTITE